MIQVINWTKFQHYKERRPPWIKLYRDLLDKPEFFALSDFSCRLLLCIWMLASEAENPGIIEGDSSLLAFRLRLTSDLIAQVDESLKEIEQQGFISLASGVLAECYQGASTETEAETKAETKTETEGEGEFAPLFGGFNSELTEQVIALWAEIMFDNPPPPNGSMRARFLDDVDKFVNYPDAYKTEDDWREYFTKLENHKRTSLPKKWTLKQATNPNNIADVMGGLYRSDSLEIRM